MNTAIQVQILDNTVCISYSTSIFGQRYESVLPPFMVNRRVDRALSPWYGNDSRKRKTLNSNILNSAKNWPCVTSYLHRGIDKCIYIYIYIYIYIHIYIYIVIHRQTVSLYHNSSVRLDTWDTSSWDQNPPDFTSDWWHTSQPAIYPTQAKEFNVYVLTSVCLHYVSDNC